MAEFEVWHQHGTRYEKVAVVDVADVEAATILTAFSPERWHEYPQIRPEPGHHRATMFGDVIINPEGVEFRFEAEVDRGYPGFTEVSVVFHQGYIEYLAEQAIDDALAIGMDMSAVCGRLETERAPRGGDVAEPTVETARRDSYDLALDGLATRVSNDNSPDRGPSR